MRKSSALSGSCAPNGFRLGLGAGVSDIPSALLLPTAHAEPRTAPACRPAPPITPAATHRRRFATDLQQRRLKMHARGTTDDEGETDMRTLITIAPRAATILAAVASSDTPRKRRRLARGLRRTANRRPPRDPAGRRRELLLCHRVAAVRGDLLEIADLLDCTQDTDPRCVAELQELLMNGCESPLYNPDVHISELRATLHYIRSGLATSARATGGARPVVSAPTAGR
jgi:hypothetical protein